MSRYIDGVFERLSDYHLLIRKDNALQVLYHTHGVSLFNQLTVKNDLQMLL